MKTDLNTDFIELFKNETSFKNEQYSEDILVSQCMSIRPSMRPSVLSVQTET